MNKINKNFKNFTIKMKSYPSALHESRNLNKIFFEQVLNMLKFDK